MAHRGLRLRATGAVTETTARVPVLWSHCPSRPACTRPAGRGAARSPVSACCSSDERGDYVGSVPVQGPLGAVVADRGPRVGMGGGFLYVPQRNPGIERRGDERVAQ